MLTLQEAIDHCYEAAGRLKCSNGQCSAEHLQLAKWLEELKERRENGNRNVCQSV